MIHQRKVKKITHYFLESGHSQNEGDSVHAVIDKAVKNLDVFTPQQYYILMRSTRKSAEPYKVKEMDYTDFLDYKGLANDTKLSLNWEKYQHGETVRWSEVKVLQVDSILPGIMKLKTQHDDTEWKYIKVQKRNMDFRGRYSLSKTEPERAYRTKRGISARKLKDITSLMKYMPREYHGFYNTIDKTASSDSEDDNE